MNRSKKANRIFIKGLFEKLSQNNWSHHASERAELYCIEPQEEEEQLTDIVRIKRWREPAKIYKLTGQIPKAIYSPYCIISYKERHEWESETGEKLSGSPCAEYGNIELLQALDKLYIRNHRGSVNEV